jgi:glycosyltransferase involved in cell wall biosynthesis
MPTVSVVLITLNEEKNIDRCLGSVRWADEIVVIDSFSRDRTVELAKKYTDKVFQNRYEGSTRQMLYGVERSSGDWILFIDGDEEVSPELAEEIRKAVQEPGTLAGYDLLRKPWAFGSWIEHGGWYPDYQFRLLRKDGFTVNHEEVHGGFEPRGPKGRLGGVVYHYTYPTIYSYLARMNDYTSLQVSNILRTRPGKTVRWYNVIFSPLSHFLRMYLSNKGYKDGFQGFALALLDAVYSMMLYLKLWEFRFQQRRGGELPPITNVELNRMKSIS